MLELDLYSRFKGTGTTLLDSCEVFGVWTKPSLLTRVLRDDQIQYYVVNNSKAGRPDLISYEIYGTTLLDWLVIAFNRGEVLNWPRAGQVIKLPISSLVLSELV